MAITPFTNLPTPTSPDTFSDDTDNFINVQLTRFATEVDLIATAFTLNATNSTSSTSLSIGIGTKNYTVETGKSYLAGMFVIAADTSSPSANYNYGQVLSYDSGTGVLSIDVTDAQGSGTKTAWSISQTASGGVTNAGATFTGDVIVPDEAYNSTLWDTNNEVPTKNAFRDEIESVKATIAATGIGVGQTWQDVSGSRAHSTSYQNNTGKPIQFAVGGTSSSTVQVSENNSTWVTIGGFSGAAVSFLTAIVPNNWYYKINGAMTITYWTELR